ncbi:MAG: hypothetical protein OXG69_12030 [bacterium]|nr:hypothetical protein [bacterium]
MVDVVAQTRGLVRIVAQDAGLPRFARRQANELVALAGSQPDLVLDKLEGLRRQIVPRLPLEPPTCDYARCVPVATFWRHHIRPERRALFTSPEHYRIHLESGTDPAATACRDLADGRLVPAKNSWLVPADRISGLDGANLKSRLKLDGAPPYIVMVLSAEKMKAAGVAVREPRGVDVIPGRFSTWSPGDIPGERIDQDIPVAALEALEWRP